LLLISIYSQVIFGIGIALAIAALLAIYVTSLASQSQSDIQQQQQQQQIPSSPPSTSTSSPSSVSASITIPQGAAAQQVKTYFMPNPSTVTANSKVTWNNNDIAQHTATVIDGSFDTGIINVGSSGSAIVKAQGTVPYHCTIHPWMNGIL
jgi:plastocyanin